MLVNLIGDVIQMYKKNGYKFITLGEALQDNPAEVQEATPNNEPDNLDDVDDLEWMSE